MVSRHKVLSGAVLLASVSCLGFWVANEASQPATSDLVEHEQAAIEGSVDPAATDQAHARVAVSDETATPRPRRSSANPERPILTTFTVDRRNLSTDMASFFPYRAPGQHPDQCRNIR